MNVVINLHYFGGHYMLTNLPLVENNQNFILPYF